MVQIIEKKLIQLGKSLCVTVPPDWVRMGFLKKGSTVDMVVMKFGILIVDRGTDFNANCIKADLDLAQNMWNGKEDRKNLGWFNKLSPKEQEKIKKNWEETTEALTGKFDETNVVHLDSPDWNIKPREPCDLETMKLWTEKHPEQAKKEAEKALRIEHYKNLTKDEQEELRQKQEEVLQSIWEKHKEKAKSEKGKI